MASLAGLAVGGDDGNRGSAGHFGGSGLFVAVVDSKREDSESEEFANVGGATSRLAQQPKSWHQLVIASLITRRSIIQNTNLHYILLREAKETVQCETMLKKNASRNKLGKEGVSRVWCSS